MPNGNVCHAAADRIAELEAALGERTLERDDALRGRSHTNTDLRRIADEYKTERDGAKRDAMRAFDERNIAFAERDASQARIAELEAALAAAEKDAARYRWLKINARRIDFAGLCVSDGAQLDARIDAAIRAEAK